MDGNLVALDREEDRRAFWESMDVTDEEWERAQPEWTPPPKIKPDSNGLKRDADGILWS